MWVQILLLILGLALLLKGADWLVGGASALAKRYNISDLAIGLTIVAFGTSAPEMVVNTFSSFQGHHDIVFGNVIGSNNFNLFVILGITGLITPIVVQSSTVWKEIPMSLVAVIVFYILANYLFDTNIQVLSRVDGLILLTLFGLFLYYVYKQLSTDPETEIITPKKYSNLKMWGFIILGLTGLVIGGKLIVNAAVEMAIVFGVSEKIIGLTIIAAGTSLPELATSVVAAFKKNSDIAVGNIVGSNIFNILLVLSLSSFVKPLSFNKVFNTDIYILFLGTLLVFIAMFTGKKKKLDRWEAGILLLVYVAYTVYLVNKEI